MRLLSYNLWHGLSPQTGLLFDTLEPAERLRLREERQLTLFSQLKPDICFLQEVNPVHSRVQTFANHLDWKCTYQPDLVGVKVLGVGVPLNLNSGLVIATSKFMGQRHVKSLSLDRPGASRVWSHFSWQLKEERFALFSETILRKWGRVLLVNTHLHHGLEATSEFQKALEALAEEKSMTASMMGELKERIKAGGRRRLEELKVLMNEINELAPRYQGILLGGDLNFSPSSAEYAFLHEQGFVDLWGKNSNKDGYTFDSQNNMANHRLQERFPLTLVLEDLTFSAKTKEALLTLARKQETRPRRIDYLFMKSTERSIEINSRELVGRPDAEGFAPSDHFGVLVELED